MLVYPAVDIAGGRCVRLSQGKLEGQTVYYEDPVEAALRWQNEGAGALHVVDLEGALSRALDQEVDRGTICPIRRILEHTQVPVQVAGGLRTTHAVHNALCAGAARAVVGTRAVRDPRWARCICRSLPGRVVIALDAREGRVAVEGWQDEVDESPAELARRLAEAAPAAFLYTDVSRDGMLTRPHFEGVRDLLEAVEVPVIASGGVADLEDIRELGECGADAVIVGKALYEERFPLAEALELADRYPSRLAPRPQQ